MTQANDAILGAAPATPVEEGPSVDLSGYAGPIMLVTVDRGARRVLDARWETADAVVALLHAAAATDREA